MLNIVIGLIFQVSAAWANPAPQGYTLAYSPYHHQVAVLKPSPTSLLYQFQLCSFGAGQNPLQPATLTRCKILSPLHVKPDQIENFMHQLILHVESDFRWADLVRWLDMTGGSVATGIAITNGLDVLKKKVHTAAEQKPALSMTLLTVDILLFAAGSLMFKKTTSDTMKLNSFAGILTSLYNNEEKKMIDIDRNTWNYFVEELKSALKNAEEAPEVWVNSCLIDAS